MIRCGIDPGLDGAFALLRDDAPPALADMPTVARTHGKGRQVNAAAVIGLLECWAPDLVVIERQAPMPKQGTVSAYSLGRSVGVLEGACAALGLELHWTLPAAWKRAAGLLGRDKDASRTRALELWPELADRLARKRDHGRAEAALVARFGGPA